MPDQELPAYTTAFLDVVRNAEVAGRLPTPTADVLGTIFPFEADGLSVVRIDEPELPEPDRGGVDPATCRSCQRPDSEYDWTNERWRLEEVTSKQKLGIHTFMLTPRQHVDIDGVDDDLAAEQGQLLVRVERAIRAGIDRVGRVHIYRWGDGGVHLHWWFIARPAGMLQFRGSGMGTWLDVLPPLPVDVVKAHTASVVAQL
jgi:hypothetical protein